MRGYTQIFPVLLIFIAAITASAQQTDRELGIELYRDGKFSEAIPLLEKSVAANENDRSAWIYLGGAYVHTGNEEAAMRAFTKKIDPNLMVSPTKFEKTVKITYKEPARYTAEARRKRSSGRVKIAVELRANGTVGFIFPLQTTMDDSLLRSAMDAAKAVRFEPAIKDGKPVTVINFFDYSFQTY